MVEIFTARSGRPSLRVGGVAFHSPFDPQREASQFAERSFPEGPPSLVILLGEGLGYATRAIEERFPGARVVPLFYSTEIFANRFLDPHPSWHPGDSRSLEEFVISAIGEFDLEGLRVIEWPPASRLFPELSRSAHAAVKRAVLEANGSFMTTAGMGRLWLRNSLLNFLSFESVLTGEPCGVDSPILIAASGPSLERHLSLIREKRDSFDLWALPSSLLALRDAGISPDMVVMTDPGHWSVSHLDFTAVRCPIAMPLSAARGIWRFEAGVFLLAQPAFFEMDLLNRAAVSATSIPPNGTVAATALSLALDSSRAIVILAGLDLCFFDILCHARPNGFDRLLASGSSRLTPHYSQSYHWACSRPFHIQRHQDGVIRIPRSHDAYAGWFGSVKSARIFRLGASPVSIPSMGVMEENALNALPKRKSSGPNLRVNSDFPPQAKRKDIVAGILNEWREVLGQGLQYVRKHRDPSGITRPPLLLSLAYHTEAGLLMEVRRKARMGDLSSACDSAVELLQNSLSFLGSLEEKILA